MLMWMTCDPALGPVLPAASAADLLLPDLAPKAVSKTEACGGSAGLPQELAVAVAGIHELVRTLRFDVHLLPVFVQPS